MPKISVSRNRHRRPLTLKFGFILNYDLYLLKPVKNWRGFESLLSN